MFNQKHFTLLNNFQNSDTPCVSIYLPTYRYGSAQEDRIRYKNALAEAIVQLTDGSIFYKNELNKKDAITFLAPAFDLLENDDFWNHLSDGLAVFIGKDHFSYFVTPLEFPEFVHAHDHFYLRHMMPMLNKNNKFFVLALSQNEVRFFEGNEMSITPVIIQDLVPNGKEAVVNVEDNSKNLQGHSSGGTVIFHGYGGGKDDKNEELIKYFREVDNGLMEMLHDETAPMIIYSVDYQIPIYQDISKYSNINNNHITGNPESDDPVLIHERAWSVMKDYFVEENKVTREEFNQNLVDGKASFSLHEIVPAAIQGKVETLFLDKNEEVIWGEYDEKEHTIQFHEKRQAKSICLLNKSAVSTIDNGGKVTSRLREELPRVVSHTNAIFRY